MTGDVVTTIYLSGQIRRPVDSEFKPGWPDPTYICSWCGKKTVAKTILPEGWFALGDVFNDIRYGCADCYESEIPHDAP